MFIEDAERLDRDSLLSEDVLRELFGVDDAYLMEKYRQALVARAAELKCKTDFNRLYQSYRKELKKANLQYSDKPSNITDFTDQPIFKCGSWIATEEGVFTLGERGKLIACPHPIYIKRILINAETGIHKAEICYKVRGRWRSCFIDRKSIASRSGILALADNGVQITSENAALLVQFLAELEAWNPEDIREQTSTSRLGWIGEVFMPYGDEIVFDNEQNLLSLFNSIKQVGSRQAWYECVKKIRQKGRIENLIYIAASLGSVLVEPVGALPFVVDLWGETGKGKTVALMVATSIWADPNEGAYMTDAKATTTAMEVRLNVLNSLPMTLDDMAQIKNQYDEDFSSLVYRWCAGKGRDRSNKELGINKLTSWHNCILTNAEHSLITETMQGGAINRIIDIEMDETPLFPDGNAVADLMRHNYGWCGREFVEQVQLLGFDEIRRIQRGYVDQIGQIAKDKGVEKEEKQILPMSIILTADEIAERYLFQDGVSLDIKECVDLLKNKGEVSEHKRAYQFIKETIATNPARFENDPDDKFEAWGIFRPNEQYATIVGKVFDRIAKEGNFQPKAFLSWAKKQEIVKTDSQGNTKIQTKVNGCNVRCVVIKMDAEETESVDFTEEDDDNPFK